MDVLGEPVSYTSAISARALTIEAVRGTIV